MKYTRLWLDNVGNGPVVYLDIENDPNDFYDRAELMQDALGRNDYLYV